MAKLYEVLKDFPYSNNTEHVIELKAGETTAVINERDVERLRAGGWIGEAAPLVRPPRGKRAR